jgi:hypothetical protein
MNIKSFENFIKESKYEYLPNMDYQNKFFYLISSRVKELGGEEEFLEIVTKNYPGEVKLAIMITFYISQVNNGGHSQYYDNGYASKKSSGFGAHKDIEQHEEMVELFKNSIAIKDPVIFKLLPIMNEFSVRYENYGDKCETCDGMGVEYIECDVCRGSGEDDYTTEVCEECGGSGEVSEDCSMCGGGGIETAESDDLDDLLYKIKGLKEHLNQYYYKLYKSLKDSEKVIININKD